jgi:hypothetical protein
MGHAPGRSYGAGALCCLRHLRRSPSGSGERRIPIEPSLDFRDGDDPQASPAHNPQLGLDVPLERRLAHANRARRLRDGEAETGR